MADDRLDPIRVLHAVTSALESAGIRYFVGGSFASIVHGEVRTTADADVVAEMDGAQAERFAETLEGFHVDSHVARTEADRGGMFQALDTDSMFRVDIHMVRGTDFHESELQRATRVQLGTDSTVTALIATAEDTVLSKLAWFEKGNRVSERQWSDVLGVVRVQGDRLDWEYMRKWAAKLGVSDTLEAAAIAGASPVGP